MEVGWWAPHPDGGEPPPALPPVPPGRVVGIGAVCDLGPVRPDPAYSFSVAEFVDLDDGRREWLHQERGFTMSWRISAPSGELDGHTRPTVECLTQDVLTVVLPDDDDPEEEHPWAWLADLAQRRGLAVTADDLRVLPYEVVFTDAVMRWLSPAQAQ